MQQVITNQQEEFYTWEEVIQRMKDKMSKATWKLSEFEVVDAETTQLGEYLRSIDAEPEEWADKVTESLYPKGLTGDEFKKEYLGSWNEKED